MEKTLKSGVYLVCPNRKASAEDDAPKKRKKKDEDDGAAVACSYQVRIGDAPVAQEEPVSALAG
jgi:DNA topoisomerase-1